MVGSEGQLHLEQLLPLRGAEGVGRLDQFLGHLA
jgi:hypothetical protein